MNKLHFKHLGFYVIIVYFSSSVSMLNNTKIIPNFIDFKKNNCYYHENRYLISFPIRIEKTEMRFFMRFYTNVALFDDMLFEYIGFTIRINVLNINATYAVVKSFVLSIEK